MGEKESKCHRILSMTTHVTRSGESSGGRKSTTVMLPQVLTNKYTLDADTALLYSDASLEDIDFMSGKARSAFALRQIKAEKAAKKAAGANKDGNAEGEGDSTSAGGSSHGSDDEDKDKEKVDAANALVKATSE